MGILGTINSTSTTAAITNKKPKFKQHAIGNGVLGGLPPAEVSTSVPLTVLVYDRDKSRRLANKDFVLKYLHEHLVEPLQGAAGDNERHKHFPEECVLSVLLVLLVLFVISVRLIFAVGNCISVESSSHIPHLTYFTYSLRNT